MMPVPSTGNLLSLIMIHFCFLPFSAASTKEGCFSDADCDAGTYCFQTKDNSSSSVCKSCLDCSSNETDCENDSKCEDCFNDGYYKDDDGICTPHDFAEASTNTLAPSTYDIRTMTKGTYFKWIISVAVCIALGLLAYMGVNKYRNRVLSAPYHRMMQAGQSRPGGGSHSQLNSIPEPSSVTISDESNKEATAATGRIIFEGNHGATPREREPVNETANNNNMMRHLLSSSMNTNTVHASTNSILTPDLPAQSSQVGIISQTMPNTFGAQPSLPSEEISLDLRGQQLSTLVSHQESRRPVYGISLERHSLDSWPAETLVDLSMNSELNARSQTSYRRMENDGNRQVPEMEIEDSFYEENEDN